MQKMRHIAIIGAGIAGITCARTLSQAGHEVTVFEQGTSPGGRMATRSSPFGNFDFGAQYFTVRDPRFALALATVPGLCKAWSANTVRVLDEHGGLAAAALPARERHMVPKPGMDALVTRLAQPLLAGGHLPLETHITNITRKAGRWQLHAVHTRTGKAQPSSTRYDAVLLATPAGPAHALLRTSGTAAGTTLVAAMDEVQVAPCWSLMLAFPQAMQPGMSSLGPQWNAARSTHHRIAWLARESSKPGRDPVERWTVQASAAWSQEHFDDEPARVAAKLHKAFSEVTGIRAEPAHADIHRWAQAQTQKPLGQSHLWDAASGIGACGDWCIGHRVEDAFVSGLELALAVA